MPLLASTSSKVPAVSGPVLRGADAARHFLKNQKSDGSFTGGDGTYSIPLGPDRTAWLFGDSFVGGVREDGSRSHEQGTFVRNSLVLQDENSFRMVTGVENGTPVDAARVPGMRMNRDGSLPDEWYWPGHGTTSGSDLLVFMNRYSHPEGRRAGSTWDWTYRGTDLATFDAATGAGKSLQRIVDGGDVQWGSAVIERADHTYIYGSSEGAAHVARAPKGALADPSTWEFWGEGSWTGDAARAAQLGPLVSNQFGVVDAKDGGVLLLSQVGFDPAIRVWHAPAPEGPFTGGKIAAKIPNQPRQRHVYNSVPHPEFTKGDSGDLLISYNVGGMDFMSDHRSYRPGFLTIPSDKLPGGGAAGITFAEPAPATVGPTLLATERTPRPDPVS